MKCEDVELEFPELSSAGRAHVETCASCQDTARVLGLAALPAFSADEQRLLDGLSTSMPLPQRQAPTPSMLRRMAGLSLAAGLGALIASTAVLQLMPKPVSRVETRVETVMVTPPEVPVLEISDELNLSDDEVFFEVGWPSPTEGDL